MKAGAVLFQFFVGNFRSRFLLDYTSQYSFTVEYQRNRCVFHLQLLELFNVRISFFTNNWHGVQAHHNERLVTFTHFHSFTLVAFFKEKFRGWRFFGRRLKGMKAREPRTESPSPWIAAGSLLVSWSPFPKRFHRIKNHHLWGLSKKISLLRL